MPPARTAVTLRQQRWEGKPVRRGARLVSWVALGVTIAVSALIVFTPGAPAPRGQSVLHRWMNVWQVIGATPTFLTFEMIEWSANVVMFLPMGFLFAGAVSPHRRFWAVPLAAAGSVFIEVVQLFIPGRVSSVSDVLANTTGSLAGVLLLIAAIDRIGGARPALRSAVLGR